jgi:beta-carotene ketolase (CrtW type)
MIKPTKIDGYKGIAIAASVILIWLISLILLLKTDVAQIPVWAVIPLMLWQAFLYTGLFITAHDAMHGLVFRQNRRINNLFGTMAVLLYALFSYKKLLKKHWEHHDHPASEEDPDYHDGEHKGFLSWYFHFMLGYLSWIQLFGMAIAFNVMFYLLNVSLVSLIIFWIVPSFLSTFQLFYFGTYLPHKEPMEGYNNPHHAQSNSYSTFWSFITCYHFGYHLEHHEYPYIAWWRLPKVRKMIRSSS